MPVGTPPPAGGPVARDLFRAHFGDLDQSSTSASPAFKGLEPHVPPKDERRQSLTTLYRTMASRVLATAIGALLAHPVMALCSLAVRRVDVTVCCASSMAQMALLLEKCESDRVKRASQKGQLFLQPLWSPFGTHVCMCLGKNKQPESRCAKQFADAGPQTQDSCSLIVLNAMHSQRHCQLKLWMDCHCCKAPQKQ
eukprot:1158199-Pelagomonas_calceolata.AAC.6